jgi:hypothetical protein
MEESPTHTTLVAHLQNINGNICWRLLLMSCWFITKDVALLVFNETKIIEILH